MQLEIHARGFSLTHALREYARARFAFALDRLRHGVRHVVVRLSDLNGPRGGRDKRVQVQVGVIDASEVIVRDTDADLYAAIDRAAERVSRGVQRRLGRTLSHRRKPNLPAVTVTQDSPEKTESSHPR
jgi:ribosomal subunit interface protein